ncbi:MAG: arsenate reductase ArsC [Candidatus Zixiibacteriota bacterium]|nr:MAG: arsenate reductase ArsC [candidate division Zixibacteria bacterium]
MMIRILFVCSGNSVRSQMAEAFARTLSDGQFEIRSAGIYAAGVHPVAAASMKEVGIDISGQSSTILDNSLINWADHLVTLCGNARENCPPIPKSVKTNHWDIINPDRLYPSEEARRQGYARVRDIIRRQVESILAELRRRD